MKRSGGLVVCASALMVLFTASAAFGGGESDVNKPVIPQLAATPTFSDSTVPANGDVNPYGVAFVPFGFIDNKVLQPGQILVSNFNNIQNIQGTGTTIVRVNNGAAPTVFFQGQQGLGLTTALAVLKNGVVLVGDLPSTDGSGTCNAISGPQQNVGQGGLLVINKNGKLVRTLASEKLLNGPWDMAVTDDGLFAQAFVANALSGTVTRLDLLVLPGFFGEGADVAVLKATQIASGYIHRCDPAAFVVGPTGVALDLDKDLLYVSSTGDNGIFAIPNASFRSSDAGMGDQVVSDVVHLHGPLGLILAPNGDLISTQGDAVNPDPTQQSEVVEFTNKGEFVSEFSVDPVAGSAFGLALNPVGNGFVFATVDDNLSVLDVWDVK